MTDTKEREPTQLAAVPTEDALSTINPELLEKYLYRFKQGNQEIVDITAEGINHIAQRARVSIEDVFILAEDDESITMKAIATDPDGNRHIGIVREPKFNQKGYPNPKALESATSKAQRNAKKGLLPMTWIKDMIERASY